MNRATPPHMPWTRRAACLVASMLLACLCACSRRPPTIGDSFKAMGGTIAVEVPAREAATLPGMISVAAEVSGSLNQLLSVYQPESEISALNRLGENVRLPISLDTYRVLERALAYNAQTDGAFDITVGSISYLWGFRGGRIPQEPLGPDVIRAGLQGVGSRHMQIEQNAAQILSPFTRVDLGGIAWGYALDLSVITARRRGVRNTLISLGRHARCLGAAGPDRPWTVSVPHPFDPNAPLGEIQLEGGKATATSLLRSETVTIAGREYSHILDPRNGLPAEGTAAAAVYAPTATEADALATAFVVLGIEGAKRILGRFPRTETLIVPDRQPIEIWVTEGMSEVFKPAPGLDGSIRVFARDASEDVGHDAE